MTLRKREDTGNCNWEYRDTLFQEFRFGTHYEPAVRLRDGLTVEIEKSLKSLKQITMQQSKILNNLPNTTHDCQQTNYKILYMQ
jgi:hypothetical protein